MGTRTCPINLGWSTNFLWNLGAATRTHWFKYFQNIATFKSIFPRKSFFVLVKNGDNCFQQFNTPCYGSWLRARASANTRNDDYGTVNWEWIYIDVIWASCCCKSPATRVFVQPLLQANTKGNIKACATGPLWRKTTDDRWIHLTKGQ